MVAEGERGIVVVVVVVDVDVVAVVAGAVGDVHGEWKLGLEHDRSALTCHLLTMVASLSLRDANGVDALSELSSCRSYTSSENRSME